MLELPVTSIPGVGDTLAKAYERLGIRNLRDLLLTFPFRYEDFRAVSGIGDLQPGQTTTVHGVVTQSRSRRSPKKKMVLTEVTVEDGTGSLTAVWFHQPYIAKMLQIGDAVTLSGTVDDRYGLSMANPQYEKRAMAQGGVHTGRLVPVYTVSGKMAQKGRRNAVRNALLHVRELEEWIPSELMQTYDLLPLSAAVQELHFPEDPDRWERAVRRMKFGELLLHQLSHARARLEIVSAKARAFPMQTAFLQDVVAALPFTPTDAQRKAVFAIVKDMERERPMHRLLEGDVGSGKTAVAALVAAHTVASGAQVAYLAPTELLAAQQAQSLHDLLGSRVTVALLCQKTCSLQGEVATKAQVLDAVLDGRVGLVVGTHALLQAGVRIPDLHLVVIDEQHRFGVEQRRRLLEPDRAGCVPHLLSMTATPIPRSLSMALYGDMDLSILDELPPNRGRVETILLKTGQADAAFRAMTQRLDAGEQAYVVCPFIEDSDTSEAQSVETLAKTLTDGPLKGYRVGMVHGRLKPAQKEEVMEAFRSGALDVLVATTVIEVGVNVPNATVMFIEGAERFGLAQLHQLRGRVRRSSKMATCFLHPRTMGGTTVQRLSALVAHDDGFALSEIDLKLRGAGDRFGTRQSGEQQFTFATLSDTVLIAQTQDLARQLIERDPELDGEPGLRDELAAYMEQHYA